MSATGRVQSEELLQLQAMGVPAAGILQEELGLTAEQVANIGNESVNAATAIQALLNGMDKRFGGMMANQSKTAKGMISTCLLYTSGTVTLEDLIYSRLTGWDALTAQLARVDGQPAIYYQVAPGDTADGWGGKPQDPRIDYTVDMQSNPERHASGVMTANIWCSETGEPPESLEPELRAAIRDVFLQPDSGPPISLSWARSDAFQAQSRETLVNGITCLLYTSPPSHPSAWSLPSRPATASTS